MVPGSMVHPGIQKIGPVFDREVYEYPNNQRAQHFGIMTALGITFERYAGLAGMYIIRDEHERLNPPAGFETR